MTLPKTAREHLDDAAPDLLSVLIRLVDKIERDRPPTGELFQLTNEAHVLITKVKQHAQYRAIHPTKTQRLRASSRIACP